MCQLFNYGAKKVSKISRLIFGVVLVSGVPLFAGLSNEVAFADASAAKLSPLIIATSNKLDSIFFQCQDNSWQYYLPKRDDLAKDYPAILTTKDPYGKFGPVGPAIAACDAKMKLQNATQLSADESAAVRYVLDECKGSSAEYAENRSAVYKKFPGIGSKQVKNTHNGTEWTGTLDANVKYCLSYIKAAETKESAEIAQNDADTKDREELTERETQEKLDKANAGFEASRKETAENFKRLNQKDADQEASYKKYQRDLHSMVSGERLALLEKLGDPESLSDDVAHDHSAKSAAHAKSWSYSVARRPATGRIQGNAGQSYEVKIEQESCVTWYHFKGDKISRTEKMKCN